MSCFSIRPALPSLFFDEQVDKVHTVKEAYFSAVLDQMGSKCCCDIGFAGSGSADEDQVVFVVDELPGAELVYPGFLDGCFTVIKGG